MGLETIALVALASASAVSAYGSISAASASRAEGRNAQAAANAQAGAQLDQATAEANTIRDRNRRVIASQRSVYLKSGITLDDTASDVIYDSSIQGELDALNALYRGRVGASSSVNQGNLARQSANNRATSYTFQGIGSILGAASYGARAYQSTQPTFQKNGLAYS